MRSTRRLQLQISVCPTMCMTQDCGAIEKSTGAFKVFPLFPEKQVSATDICMVRNIRGQLVTDFIAKPKLSFLPKPRMIEVYGPF